MKTCGICSREDRPVIDAALVDGASLRAIAGQYGTTKSALDRHRKHIPAALVKAKAAIEVAEAGRLLSRVEGLVSRCERIYDAAMIAGELTGAVGATRELRGCLELLGKLSGELQSAGARIAINFANITEVDIKALTDTQLEDLYARISKSVETMSDEELNRQLFEITAGTGFGSKAACEAYFFDDQTVAPGPGGNRVCWTGGSWSPYRNASHVKRFEMLQAAWKRVTGMDLPADLSHEALGPRAAIFLDFDLADPQEESWVTWPRVRLVTAGGRKQNHPKTIEGTA